MIDPLNEKTSGYHLFLMPKGEAAGKELKGLGEVMEILANTFQCDTFAPHVTLLARISAGLPGAEERPVHGLHSEEEIRSKCVQLAKELSPFSITLTGIGAEKSFFRALYLKVSNPVAVIAAHEKALKIFSMKDEDPYVPHLSLIYGNFPEDTVSEMIESVPISDTLSFTADCLYLFHTEGPVEEWRLAGEFPFVS